MPKTVQNEAESESFEGLETFTKDTPISKMPASPGARVKDDKWFAYLKEIPEEAWQHLIIYGYRWWPIIDKRLVDPSATTNIFKSEGVITRDWLLKTWGTGVYNLKLNDTSKRKGQTVTECVIKFEEPYAEYPPVLDYGELVLDNKDNKGFIEWAIAHGKLEGRGDKLMPSADMGATQFLVDVGKKTLEESRVRPATQPIDKGLDRAVDMMGKAYEKSIEILSKPEKSSAQELGEVAKVLKDLGLGTGNSQGDVLNMFLKLQADMQKLIMDSNAKQMDLMMKIVELQNKPVKQEGSMIEQVKSIAEVFEIMQGIGGGKGAGDWKSTLVETVGEFVPKALQATSNLMHNIAVFKGMKTGQPIPPEQMVTDPSLLPGVAPNPADMQQQQQINLAMIEQLGTLVYDAIHRDMNGKQWGMAFIDMHGRAQYDAIAAAGKDAMVEGLKLVPPLWAKFEPIQPTLDKFLSDFIVAGEELDKQDEDEE